MDNSKQLADLQQELMKRQWIAIKNYEKSIDAGFKDRMEEYRMYGTHTLQTIIADAGVTAEDLTRCTIALNNDPRLEFLSRLPHAAAMGGAFGDALEKSIYQSSSGQSRETTALIGMFIRILDSLIDDAPELIIAERATLLNLLGKKSWESDIAFPGDDELAGRHPAISLLYKFMRESVVRIKRSDYWQSETSAAVRETFSSAAQDALGSEYRTLNCRIEAQSGDFDPGIQLVIREKSESMMLVIALAPVTHFGWPESLDTAAYASAVRKLGATFGWMDDVSDLADDFNDGNWSEVLIELYVNGGMPSYSTKEELHEILCGWLRDEAVMEMLVAKGLSFFRETLLEFEALQIDPLPLHRYTTDVTLSWVDTG